MTLSINFSKVLAVCAVVLACVTPVAFAHATELDYGGSYADEGFYTTPFDTGSDFGGSYADSGYYTTPTSYDFGGSYADNGYYTTPASYGYGGGYSSGSYFTGGGFSGSGFGGGGSTYAPTTISTYAPVSTCTAPNSCNSTVDDHSIFNAPTTVTIVGGGQQQQQQQVVYQPMYQPVYQAPVYAPTPIYSQPIARAPYVSLSAVPYTGLDLGPWGTALYWTFLVLWCLGATYLVVVKRVQNKLVSNLNNFLFGSTVSTAHTAKATMHAAPAKAHSAPAVHEDGTDPFIQSQIAR